jgi:hypothetical protein
MDAWPHSQPVSAETRHGGHRKGWTTTRLVLYGKEQNGTLKTILATCMPANMA